MIFCLSICQLNYLRVYCTSILLPLPSVQPSPPYHEAITELCRVIDLHTPSAKLSCLVRTSRQVVQCIDDFYCTQGQSEEATDSGV